jgi:hypothetical protein
LKITPVADFRFFFVAICFALGYKGNGTRRVCGTDAPLTLSPTRQAIWLRVRLLYPPARDESQTLSLSFAARSLNESKSQQWTTTAQSGLCSKTGHISHSMLNRSFASLPIFPTGKLTTTNLSNAGHLSVPNSQLCITKHEPACNGRVLSFLLGLFLEQHVYGILGIAANNQPFLLWSRLTLLSLQSGFFWHIIVEYRIRQKDQELVPQPGIGPGQPRIWPHGCKPCASANSATGGHFAGTVVSVPASSKRYIVVSHSFPFEVTAILLFFAHEFAVLAFSYPTKNFVDGLHRRTQPGKIIAAIYKFLADLSRSQALCIGIYENGPYGISEAKGRNVIFIARVNTSSERCEVIQDLLEVRNLVPHFRQFVFKGSPLFFQPALLTVQRIPCLFKISSFHDEEIVDYV